VITGPVKLSNSKLAGFNLGQKLSALSALTGKTASNPDTSIQNASLNARVAPEGTKADNINLTVPAIGVITGGGTVSPAGALNFNMLANLEGGMAGNLTRAASVGGGKGIPFTIQGTTSNPSFVPNLSGVAGSVAQGALQNVVGKGAKTSPTSALGGLLGKKKPH
jgi:AsmA protein